LRIEPQSEIVLARGLEDHQDSTTYYVRAVIRNAKTDALIDTINLTDQGNRRFTKEWRVPADPTGEGFDILITYTAYTDSAYTTKSSNYGEKFEEHRIEHIPKHSGGGGGSDVDYNRVKKIIAEEIKKIVFPDPKDPDFSPFSNSLQAILTEVRANRPVPAKEADFSPLMARFEALERSVLKAIKDKETTPQTDLQPVLDAFETFKGDMTPNVEDFQKKLDALFDRIKEFLGNDVDEFKAGIQSLKKEFNRIAFIVPVTKPKEDED